MLFKPSVKVFFALLCLLLIVGIKSTQRSNANTNGNYQMYLPVVLQAPLKHWSGVHLGNRNGGLWETGMLDAIDPRDGDGYWPANLVILSNQLYTVERNSSDCYVTGVTANPNAVNSGVFEYIQAASQHGSRVIVRIFPSPGNFIDYDDPAWSNHRLSAGGPVGGDYCGTLPDGRPKDWVYRSPLDIALEMLYIELYNRDEYGFEVFGYLPANEPNIEWYVRPDGGWPIPNIENLLVWQDMDVYFTQLFEKVQDLEDFFGIGQSVDGARMLTPAMAQNFYAEGIDFFVVDSMGNLLCDKRIIPIGEDEEAKGYELMPLTYGSANMGLAWHNYWIADHELYNECDAGGGHVSFYFPQFMKDAVDDRFRPPLILEADIGSPNDDEGGAFEGQIPIAATDFLDKDEDVIRTSESKRHFFNSEVCFGGGFHYDAAPRVGSWLLSDNVGNLEHDWHEAYRDSPVERDWFTRWWLTDDEKYYNCPEGLPPIPTAIASGEQLAISVS